MDLCSYTNWLIVTGGIGSLGQDVITAIIESGGDAICIDYSDSPPENDWSKYSAYELCIFSYG